MLKTMAGLVPLAIGLAVFGVVIWLLLGRNMALGRWLLAAFFVGHGLVHGLFLVPPPAATSASANRVAYPFDMARSWLVTGAGIDLGLVRVIGAVLVVAVAIGFVLTALATVGLLIPTGWWQGLVVASTGASVALLVLFFSPELVLGLAIDAVLLWLVVASVWSPVATFAHPAGAI